VFARISYNSPVVLTYALIAVGALVIGPFLPFDVKRVLLSAPTVTNFDLASPLTYLKLVTHVVGHANWTHLTSNFFLILLIGPLLEEKYGSRNLFGMILFTALATGLVNAFFMPTSVMGASGVVFMMILLSGFTGVRGGEIPLTFVLIAAIYLSGEVIAMMRDDNISQLAHLVGGIAGSAFGFGYAGLRR